MLEYRADGRPGRECARTMAGGAVDGCEHDRRRGPIGLWGPRYRSCRGIVLLSVAAPSGGPPYPYVPTTPDRAGWRARWIWGTIDGAPRLSNSVPGPGC